MNERITLSVLLLRKHKALYNDHQQDPDKKYLGRMLYTSCRRALTLNEAERSIETLKKVRGMS